MWRRASTAGLITISLALGGMARAEANAARGLTNDQKTVHALNRLAFGPRPGDLEQVRKQGLTRWIDAQFHPESLDARDVDARAAALTDLDRTSGDLATAYIDGLKAAKALKEAKKADANGQTPARPAVGKLLEQPGVSVAAALGELAERRLLYAIESPRQLQEVLVDFWTNHFNIDVKKGPSRVYKIVDEREVIRPHVFDKFRTLLEASAKSPAMLFYLDNALSTRNFDDPATAPNLAAANGAAGFGFRGNRAAPGAGLLARIAARRAAAGQPAKGRKGAGLNENYGRELMELHTLGVDGGYTQKDVTEVARCFTGWSINRKSGEFQFYPPLHDGGEKMVLGHRIAPGGGINDGEQVLDILASHPSTAKFISRKLCQRFVSDQPSAALVDRTAKVFLRTDGDLRAVVRSIVTSSEFNSPAAEFAKLKSPFEYAVSAARALGATYQPATPAEPAGKLRLIAIGQASINRGQGGNGARFRTPLAREVALMGEPLYGHEAPTGYPEDSREWLASGALIARFNYAIKLTQGQVAGVQLPTPPGGEPAALRDPESRVDALSAGLIGAPLSAASRDAIVKQAGPTVDNARLSALILGSPEFQKR